MYKNFKELRDSLSATEPKTLVVAAAHDEHTLEAVFSAAETLPMKYILVGERDKILEISKKLGKDVPEDVIVDAKDNHEAAVKSVELIRNGKGNVLMKGIVDTGVLLKPVLDRETGIRGSGTMSHVAVLEVPAYHKLVAITDAAMLPHPTFEQKVDILKNAVEFFSKLGIKKPKISALAAVETVSEKMPETVHAQKLMEMCKNGELGDCHVEGPLSFDLSVSEETAKIKKYSGTVTGDVDIFLAPEITAGNVLTKGLMYWGGAKMAGGVVGAKVPIVLVSRGSSAEEKLLSIALCLKAGG